MKLSKTEKAAFLAAGEPRTEPEYIDAAKRLYQTLTPAQVKQLDELLCGFGELVRYERQWYFHKGFHAAKTKDNSMSAETRNREK